MSSKKKKANQSQDIAKAQAEETTQKESDKEAVTDAENTAETNTDGKKESEKSEVCLLNEQLTAQKESYLRLAAEYENYRKRTTAEKSAIYNDAIANAVTELLPIADSIEMAIKNTQGTDSEMLKGIELIANQLESSFTKLGVEKFGIIGDDFDPELHNAVSKIESEDLGENKLSQVFQTGYKTSDKVIRHAMVQVANCD